jgi:hypothetical protein
MEDWMMNRSKAPLFAAAALVTLMATPTSAQVITLRAELHGGNETPAPILTGAFGTATVVVNMTARTISWTIDVFNYPSGLSAGHIHVGPPGVSGPTMVNFAIPGPLSNDFRLTGTATDAGITLRPEQGIRTPDDAYQSILGNATYVNLHSLVNPGGEIRGQLIRVP